MKRVDDELDSAVTLFGELCPSANARPETSNPICLFSYDETRFRAFTDFQQEKKELIGKICPGDSQGWKWLYTIGPTLQFTV